MVSLEAHRPKEVSQAVTLPALGISRMESNRWQQLGYTQEEVGHALGVAQNTVSDNENIIGSDIAFTPPDLRVQISESEHPKITERLESGEDLATIAADYKVTPQRVGQIAKGEKKKQKHAEAKAEGRTQRPSLISKSSGESQPTRRFSHYLASNGSFRIVLIKRDRHR